MTRPTAAASAISGATSLDALLADKPPVRASDPAGLRARVRQGHRLVVLDDDPTGTQRTVSAALVKAVRDAVATIRPKFVVAKGGITSSDVATVGLEITRAWSRGTLLPGMVSLWEPISGPAQGIPYIVFAGNVGSDAALLEVVTTLRAADAAHRPRKEGRATAMAAALRTIVSLVHKF